MAMCIVIVAALEAVRTGRTWLVVTMCAAGVIGSWTLPQFAIAFGATSVAVALERSVRRATVVGLGTSIALIYAGTRLTRGQSSLLLRSRTAFGSDCLDRHGADRPDPPPGADLDRWNGTRGRPRVAARRVRRDRRRRGEPPASRPFVRARPRFRRDREHPRALGDRRLRHSALSQLPARAVVRRACDRRRDAPFRCPPAPGAAA